MTGARSGGSTRPQGQTGSADTQDSLDDFFDDDFEVEFSSYFEQDVPEQKVCRGHDSVPSGLDLHGSDTPVDRSKRLSDSGCHSDVWVCNTYDTKAAASSTSNLLSPGGYANTCRLPDHSACPHPSSIDLTPAGSSDHVHYPLAASTPQRHLTTTSGSERRPTALPETPRLSIDSESTPRKRKFPGPAGILPTPTSLDADKLKEKSILTTSSDPEGHRLPQPLLMSGADARRTAISSQTSSTPCSYSGAVWQRMMHDLQIPEEDLYKHSIDNVKRTAARKMLKGGKVPFLAAVIDSINVAISDASVLLKDPTGEMHGTMLKQLVREYPTQLRPGSLLVLKQVAVFSPSTRRQYLNITPNNVLCIYGESDSHGVVVTLAHHGHKDLHDTGGCSGNSDGSAGLKEAVRDAVACLPFVPAVRVQPDRRPAAPGAERPAITGRGAAAGGRGNAERLAAGQGHVTSRQLGGGCTGAAAAKDAAFRPAAAGGRDKPAGQTHAADNRLCPSRADDDIAAARLTAAGRSASLPPPPLQCPTRPSAACPPPQTSGLARSSGGQHQPASSSSSGQQPTEQLWQDSDWDELDLELP